MTDSSPRTSRQDPGVAGALALAGTYADELVVGTVRDVHGAVARRAFGLTTRATGQTGRRPQLLHDSISKAVYGGIGTGIRLTAGALEAAEKWGLGPRWTRTRPAGTCGPP